MCVMGWIISRHRLEGRRIKSDQMKSDQCSHRDRMAAWASAMCSVLTLVEVTHGCRSASLALRRLTGSITNSFCTRSRASLLTFVVMS